MVAPIGSLVSVCFYDGELENSERPIDETLQSGLGHSAIWLSTNEAAQYLGKTKNAIWILLCRGLLIKRKWRRRLYFKKAELDRLLETSLI